MKNEAKWFASLSIKENLISEKLAAQVAGSLPADAGAEAFAAMLYHQKLATDLDQLRRLVKEAEAKGKTGAEPQPAALPVNAGAIDFSGVPAMTPAQAKDFMLGLLQAVQAMGASDLHLSSGTAPFVRNMRILEFVGATPLSAEDAKKLNTCLLSAAEVAQFEAKRDFDYALAMDGGRRIRANLMLQKDGVTGTYRIVPEKIRTPAELGFKNIEVIKRLLSYHNGLILVTGPVGAGKTTTLNSLIDELNRTRTDHIITVEDPIEFMHESRGCVVTQRQAGEHTETFATALKSALREDPDVIVIGELRDLETIEMAVTASETGHLVIGTMHTSDATTTLNRLLDVFPPNQQPQIRAMVSESLRGIICQRLLPAANGGVVLACELLVNTLAVSSMIRDGKTQNVPNALDTGKREGMISMDNAILALWHEKKITDATAAANITNRMIRQNIPGGR
ncbi:MAG: PilT/PilU family type 4a pilus ATPase [Opitutaceae bacterium]|jgi:twitching motility protein PilT